ncbi:MAG TPA: carbohydrate ABC transporter permease [Paenibacillus sp.]|uniref:carbohydrate ABC transporter permease n=1 Tax=Paenibacillus sp. TaxID=58172 RepID=UPI0028D84898|nr:carbohydrate ABC transporter permease [Paenibacillus sp.]HUC91906.1 carbohydrate ABC transporter permease [Paenibacillus sp.]
MPRRFDWRHLPLLAALAFTLAPLILLFNNGLKPRDEFMGDPLGFPGRLAFENIAEAWTKAGYGQAFWNSFIVGAATIVIVCLTAGMAAYALSKLNFKGSNLIMGVLLFTMSIPMGLFLVPLFYLWKNFQLMDTLQGIILIYAAIFLPFNIFMLRSFFVGIPNELLDSGRVDGCNELRLMLQIVFPLAKPAFLTAALLVGLWTWNEFFFANAFLQTDELKTVSTRYLVFTGRFQSDWTLISAAGVITIFPVVAAYIFLQRRFIEGITEGSLKG